MTKIAHPFQEAPLFFRTSHVEGFATADSLQKKNTKAIHITHLCELVILIVPAKETKYYQIYSKPYSFSTVPSARKNIEFRFN
jgi:hypothetical protein